MIGSSVASATLPHPAKRVHRVPQPGAAPGYGAGHCFLRRQAGGILGGTVKRFVPLLLAVTIAGLLTVVAAPAGAAKFDNCDLLTKKQVSKILGHKVVATKLDKLGRGAAGE